ncbi:MAG: hypothetical protein MJ219_00620 [Mycoplasmoidaceae bacterium]|nr:hypothetical protein [Mycoplasmoidaceae bacterium]
MFYCCSFLASAPSLPDAVLAEGCYSHMFYDCDSLKIKQQDTKTTDDGFVFTCPSNIPAGAVEDMFYGTSGSWAGDPTSGKSYY